MRFVPIGDYNVRNSSRKDREKHLRVAGFKLLEMLIVVMIILILVGIAGVRYERSVLRAKEATLKSDLAVVCQAAQQFTADKGVAPTSLDKLVEAKYLSFIPTNPLTRKKMSIRDCEGQYMDRPPLNDPNMKRLENDQTV